MAKQQPQLHAHAKGAPLPSHADALLSYTNRLIDLLGTDDAGRERTTARRDQEQREQYPRY